MSEKNFVNILNNLIKLDVDASFAYGHAIEGVSDEQIKSALTNFQADHHRHIEELSTYIKKTGGTPTEPTKDFKGYLIEGMTSLQSIMGTKSALMAMKMNEKLTNHYYQKACEHTDLTPELKALLDKNYKDEQRHLEYIENMLNKDLS
ncbi:MAG: hypothetical protein JWM09_507 [Francisellaceae bacterium]|nr:hypothetical protein [Francisellaceae bacterium]